jgi:hypothetical protein
MTIFDPTAVELTELERLALRELNERHCTLYQVYCGTGLPRQSFDAVREALSSLCEKFLAAVYDIDEKVFFEITDRGSQVAAALA